MKDKSKFALKILFGFVMLLLGALIAVLSSDIQSTSGTLLQNIGFAFIVAGVVFIFQELVMRPLTKGEVQNDIKELDIKIDDSFKNLEESYGMTALGIRMITSERRGYADYHKWLLTSDQQELFFAGNSVLHRVQADFNNLGLPRVEEALHKKLSQGYIIRIIFLDPTWDYIEKIAEYEDQKITNLITDLATTLGICKRTCQVLEKKNLHGKLDIRVCQELQHYAFHYTNNIKKNEIEMLVGFYFAGRLGTYSPLFKVENRVVQEIFLQHFDTIFKKSKTLLEYSPPGINKFNQKFYNDCRVKFLKFLDEDIINELCP